MNIDSFNFFMENAPTHKAEEIQVFLQNINIKYNCRYSPVFNPTEELFGYWKT